MAFLTGVTRKTLMENNPGCVFRQQIANGIPDTDFIGFVAGYAAGSCGSTERLVAAQAGRIQFLVSLQEWAGTQQEIGKGYGQCRKYDGAQ